MAVQHLLPSDLEPAVAAGAISILGVHGRTVLRPRWAGQGFPADVRSALVERPEASDAWGASADEVPVFVAREFSPGARALLQGEGISWADETGAGEIRVPPGVFISRLDHVRAPSLGPRVVGGVRWTPLASDVAEVVVSDAIQAGGAGAEQARLPALRAIADSVQASQSAVGKVLAQFDDAGYTEKRGASRGPTAGRALLDPAGLLSEWAGYYVARLTQPELLYHVPWRDPEASAELLSEAAGGQPVLLSGEFASELVAPFLTGVSSLLAYVEAPDFRGVSERLSMHADVTAVTAGGRIRVRAAQPHLASYSRVLSSGLRVAPLTRVYADLLAAGGRSAEAAEVLRQEHIGW